MESLLSGKLGKEGGDKNNGRWEGRTQETGKREEKDAEKVDGTAQRRTKSQRKPRKPSQTVRELKE